MEAGIIAAGWGERLGQKIPKALTPVGGKTLIDFVLDGLESAGASRVTCIVNEAARVVSDYVSRSKRSLEMNWIIQTTPSSMHSFLIVLDRLVQQSSQNHFLMTTVDSVCPPAIYSQFVQKARLFSEADVVLGLTDIIDDEKPLRVAMRGEENTGLLPDRIQDNPEAYEILAMTTHGFDSIYVTSGFYWVSASILKEKPAALKNNFTALRQYLGHLLKQGYRFYGVPLPPVVDVDRPQDIVTAERSLERVQGTGDRGQCL